MLPQKRAPAPSTVLHHGADFQTHSLRSTLLDVIAVALVLFNEGCTVFLR